MIIMRFGERIPIVIYDNHCYLCVKFAKIINFFSRGRIAMVGHYSSLGQKIREDVLDDSALQMFWLINEKNAFGGRAALLPLVKAIISLKKKESVSIKINEQCDHDCKTVKAVFIRSVSLLSNSKKIEF